MAGLIIFLDFLWILLFFIVVFMFFCDPGETGELKLELHQHGGEVVPDPFAIHNT